MAVARLATERWMADEQAEFVQEPSAGTAMLLAVAAGVSPASRASQSTGRVRGSLPVSTVLSWSSTGHE
ncbi:hypothetical protein N4P33_18885 [Streptomyces sp. 15-116A]|uniref:hypothetical protein n=1 Tax=Streptomyces sp. 15-116A TaxID=2259035 RepID=UPI0021B4C869|nr:hypothetical protein [Streptomyces sp. 15-116A]MCT7354202.1 hypothetical protein [Streptomyces sp. 15-116A]